MGEFEGVCILTHISGDAHHPIGLGDSTSRDTLKVYQIHRRAMFVEQLNTEYYLFSIISIDKLYGLLVYIGHNSGYIFNKR